MKELTERFPEILFEGCAAGGNRFDLGILCYFPQIWGSDDTDALCRAEIEENYSYGYPQCSCVCLPESPDAAEYAIRDKISGGMLWKLRL